MLFAFVSTRGLKLSYFASCKAVKLFKNDFGRKEYLCFKVIALHMLHSHRLHTPGLEQDPSKCLTRSK